jgi:Ca2+-binding RTX toxin-like protein
MADPVVSPEILVNSDPSHEQDSEIVRLADGRFLVVWTRDPFGLGQSAHGQLFDASGAKVGGPIQFGATEGVGSMSTSATAAPDGGFLVAFNTDVAGGAMDVHLGRYDAGGARVAATHLTLPGQQYATTVDALQGGGFALTYIDNEAARNNSLKLQRLDDAGAPIGAPITVFAGVTQNNHDYGAGLGELVQLPNGDLLVAFVRSDYSRTAQASADEILVQRLTAGGAPVGGPILIDGYDAFGQYATDPAITATSDGGFVVAWVRRSPTTYEAEVRKFFADGSASGTTSYVIDPIGRQGVDVDALPGGGFVLSFATSGGVDIALQTFNAAGAAAGEPIIVNAYRKGEQVGPDATWLPDGALGVTWNSLDQDGSRAAVYVAKVTGLGEDGAGSVINSPGPGSTLRGGDGADTLNASQGPDVLIGGDGGDAFAYGALPWSAGRITDFTVGADRLDLSGIFRTSGYSGSDPVADGRVRLDSDGAGGTRVYFDRDAPNAGDWPFLVTTLEGVSANGLTWAQLSGGAQQPPPDQAGQVITSPGPGSTLTGGAGADTLNASQGSDTLTGGDGGDTFAWAREPWSPATVKDFAVGSDRLDLSKVFQTAGYAGSDPIADGRIVLAAQGGDTLVLFDDDGAGGDWPNYIIKLEGVATSGLTWAKLSGGGTTEPPPPMGDGQVINSPGPGSTLTGTAGNDTLNSSQGSDVLAGAGGADHFVFAKENWSPARITDFEDNVDRIDIRGMLDAVGYTGTDPFAAGLLKLIDDGAGGTKVLFDRDAGGPNPEWPNYVIHVEKAPPSSLGSSDWIFQ